MPFRVIFRRGFRGPAAALLAALVTTLWGGCRNGHPAPSILLVVVDTLRADHVGSLDRQVPGEERGSTPEIDRWSEGAARFRRASTPAPFTMPAVAALLAGVYPDRTGVVAHEAGTTLGTWKGDTLAEAARRAGMKTAAVIANPWLARSTTGFERGFDEFVRLYQPGQPAGASGAARVTDEALRLLEAADGQPLLLWAHYFDPHMPYAPPARWAKAAGAGAAPSRIMEVFDSKHRDLALLYRGEGYASEDIEEARRLYQGEIRYVDHEVGRLLAGLESSGGAKNTIVVIASDHGESLGEHGLFFAHDFTLYEELIRVPLLVKAPGVAAATSDDEVSLLDVAPTLCRLAGLPCNGGFDGRDLFVKAPPRTLFAATTPRRARGTPWARLEVAGLAGRWTMALGDSTKLVRIPRRPAAAFEAYDLATDPGEARPLADLAVAGRLAADLEDWNARMDAARPPSPPKPDRRQRRRDEKALRSLGYLE